MSAPSQSGVPPISEELRKRLKYLPREQWPQEAIDWQEAWLHDNRAAIESWNERVRENGFPLARYRQF